jgi:hypothetical protein
VDTSTQVSGPDFRILVKRLFTTETEREGSPERKGAEQMRAYYWKVFRHLLSTTVLTGFLAGMN